MGFLMWVPKSDSRSPWTVSGIRWKFSAVPFDSEVVLERVHSGLMMGASRRGIGVKI